MKFEKDILYIEPDDFPKFLGPCKLKENLSEEFLRQLDKISQDYYIKERNKGRTFCFVNDLPEEYESLLQFVYNHSCSWIIHLRENMKNFYLSAPLKELILSHVQFDVSIMDSAIRALINPENEQITFFE